MGKPATAMNVATPQPFMIEASKLRFAREAPKELGLQVRKSNDRDAEKDAELEALIRSHGVLIPLVVKRHNGDVFVTAGNRRLRVVRKIDGEGSNRQLMAFDSDEFNGDPRAIALATNSALPMHPVDRYEVISAFAKEHVSPKDIQERFGLSPRQFAQTMRLAGMSPVIREAWRTGEITAETAQAFALSADPKHQEKVFDQIKKEPYSRGNVDAHSVRMKMVGNQHEVGPMVEFVGVAECIRAGLNVAEDLFGTLKHTVAGTDVAKLKKLADEKLKAECDRLVAAGWAWASIKSHVSNPYYYGQIETRKKPVPTAEQKARLEALRAVIAGNDLDDLSEQEQLVADEIDQIETDVQASAFTPEHRAKSGCFLAIGRHGQLEIEYGKVKPEARKSVESANRRENGTATAKPKVTAGGATITNALAFRLSEEFTGAVGAALAKQPQLALAALVAGFASGGNACEVKVTRDSYNSKAPDFGVTFTQNKGQSIEHLSVMLAQVAARALNFRTFNNESPPQKQKGAAELMAAINTKTLLQELRDRFNAKTYFESIGREAIAIAVEEAMGADHGAKVKKMDKGTAAKFASTHLPGTGWLPVWLRVPGYDGPAGAEKIKPKAKAAPAKKASPKAAKKGAKKKR